MKSTKAILKYIFVMLALVGTLYFFIINTSTINIHDETVSQEIQPVTIETNAFTATKQQNNWIISLKSKHYSDKIKSIAVTYDGTFYGVFLLSDKIYLPVLVSPTTDLTISSLDLEGRPLTSESFSLGEGNLNHERLQIPTNPGH